MTSRLAVQNERRMRRRSLNRATVSVELLVKTLAVYANVGRPCLLIERLVRWRTSTSRQRAPQRGGGPCHGRGAGENDRPEDRQDVGPRDGQRVWGRVEDAREKLHQHLAARLPTMTPATEPQRTTMAASLHRTLATSLRRAPRATRIACDLIRSAKPSPSTSPVAPMAKGRRRRARSGSAGAGRWRSGWSR